MKKMRGRNKIVRKSTLVVLNHEFFTSQHEALRRVVWLVGRGAHSTFDVAHDDDDHDGKKDNEAGQRCFI